jgi:hypothetical protein
LGKITSLSLGLNTEGGQTGAKSLPKARMQIDRSIRPQSGLKTVLKTVLNTVLKTVPGIKVAFGSVRNNARQLKRPKQRP